MPFTHQDLTIEEHETEYQFSLTTEWSGGTAYLSIGANVSNSSNDKGYFEAVLEVNKGMSGKAETVHSFSLEKAQVLTQTNPAIEVIVMEDGVELGRTVHALDSLLAAKSRTVVSKGQGTTTGAKKIKRPWKKGDKTVDQRPKKKKRTFKRYDDQSKE